VKKRNNGNGDDDDDDDNDFSSRGVSIMKPVSKKKNTSWII
jgi:hypothetical protein